ncbi:hypothetical protein SD71_21250 [Cohnella kolymensis]|uniref:Uncharacterized protein n=1 Tax=Cohnella kolymensis TaxID=1590652 RepID=A0ABR5A0J7_9BACL|nr:hypothetical protein [Cohnella kolymensis]KIL34193.1 hypothetical protein SD71_21250 [Cohnella kolymensis]
MKKKRLTALIIMSVIMSMSLFAAVASAADMSQFGFTKVVAEKKIKAGEAAQISHSGIKIDIPAGAFTNDVSFQVLEADIKLSQFNSPVMFSFKDKDVNSSNIYWNVPSVGKIAPNSTAAVIDGRTLTHSVGGAPIGWMITSPTWSVQDDN